MYRFLGYVTEHKGYYCWDPLLKHLQISHYVTFWEHKIFSTIFAFRVDETRAPLFTNPNISLFPYEIFADDSSSNLTQPYASPDEFPPPMEPANSSFVIPYLSSVSLPPPFCRTSHVSQPSIFLRDYVFNCTIVTNEPCTYHEASLNSLW